MSGATVTDERPVVVSTTTAEQTEAIGEALGRVLHSGDVVGLCGDLGAGKTTFVRGVARGMGVPERSVRSPTFVLHHRYRGRQWDLHHVDFYRLGEGADMSVVDLDTLLETGPVLVEWAQFTPMGHLDPVMITIDVVDETSRTLRVTGPSRVQAALVEMGAVVQS